MKSVCMNETSIYNITVMVNQFSTYDGSLCGRRPSAGWSRIFLVPACLTFQMCDAVRTIGLDMTAETASQNVVTKNNVSDSGYEAPQISKLCPYNT